MKKTIFKSFISSLTAILILNQAVFLFSSNNAIAQYSDIKSTEPTTTLQDTRTLTVDSALTNIDITNTKNIATTTPPTPIPIQEPIITPDGTEYPSTTTEDSGDYPYTVSEPTINQTITTELIINPVDDSVSQNVPEEIITNTNNTPEHYINTTTSIEPLSEIPTSLVKEPMLAEPQIEPYRNTTEKPIPTLYEQDLTTTEAYIEKEATLESAQENTINTQNDVPEKFIPVLPLECQRENIISPEECKIYISKKYGRPSECEGLNEEECAKRMEEIKTLRIEEIVAFQRLPLECEEAGTTSLSECEILMREKHTSIECREAGATSKEECLEIVEKKYDKPEECNDLTNNECKKLVQEVILSNFIDDADLEKINKELKIIINKHIIFKKTKKINNNQTEVKTELKIRKENREEIIEESLVKTISKFIPFAKTKEGIGLLVRETKIKEGDKETVPAVLMLDSDGDGLTDEMEIRLGTNPELADTDGDGFSDGEEVRNGYNPIGTGNLKRKLRPIEKAIINKVAIEQPKTSGKTTSDKLKIKSVKGIKAKAETENKEEILRIEGQASPNDVVSLFIYSAMPIIITIETDANGNWIYELDKTLIDGKHEAYVVINDENGNIESKSAPFSFFIKEAKAVDRDEFLKTKIVTTDRVDTMIYWYIVFGLVLIAFGISFYLFYNRRIA